MIQFFSCPGVEGESRDKALKLLTPENNITQDITIDGDAITIVTTTPIAPIEIKATNGQEFESRYLDGREIKVIFFFWCYMLLLCCFSFLLPLSGTFYNLFNK